MWQEAHRARRHGPAAIAAPTGGPVALRVPAVGICAVLYAASIAVLLASHLGHGWGFGDLAIYRDGGTAVLHGAALYRLRFPGALAFTYPPVTALLFTGLTLPSAATADLLISAASLLALPAMFGFSLRLAPLPSWLGSRDVVRIALLASAAAIWLEPVWTTLRYGQIDVFVAALVLFDLSRPDSARGKGAAIGLAIAIKLTPAIFALYLLLSRRYRAAASAAGVFAATIALGFAALPADSSEYWGGAFADSGRVGRIENTANQALRGALARVMHTLDVQSVWLLSALAVGVAGLLLAAAAGRRGDEAGGFCLCALTGLLISPISWSHHWTLAVPALLLFALGSLRRRSVAGLLACAAVALIAVAHVIWWVPVNHPPHSELHLDPLQLVYADAYVLIALGALTLSAGARLRARGGSATVALARSP